MNNIFGQIVIASRDKDFLPRDGVAAILIWFCLGAHQPQIGATMRFGQVHRARPLAADHLGQISCFLLCAAMGMDR